MRHFKLVESGKYNTVELHSFKFSFCYLTYLCISLSLPCPLFLTSPISFLVMLNKISVLTEMKCYPMPALCQHWTTAKDKLPWEDSILICKTHKINLADGQPCTFHWQWATLRSAVPVTVKNKICLSTLHSEFMLGITNTFEVYFSIIWHQGPVLISTESRS